VYSVYNNLPLLAYGRGATTNDSPRTAATSVHLAAAFNSDPIQTVIQTLYTGSASVQLVEGDSASPLLNGWTNANGGKELTVLGVNSASDFATSNYMSFLAVPGAMANANAVMTADGYALRVVGNSSATWAGGSGSATQRDNLSRGGNWSGGTIPSDRYVVFNGTGTGVRAIDVNAATNLRGLSFTSTGSSGDGFTFSGSNALTIGRGGITNYDSDRQTFSSSLTLGDHQYWDVGPGGVTAGAINTAGKLLEIAGSGTARITGAVSGSGGLALSGHRLELTGSSSYTGGTWVHAGTLVVTGGVAASSTVRVDAGATFDVSAQAGGYTVASGQTLAGNGTVAGSVTVGGEATLAPGASPGTLTVTGNATLGPGGNYNWQVYDVTGTAGAAGGWDLVSVGGVLDVASTSATPFKLNLWSLAGVGPDVNGNAINWSATTSGTWRIASAVGGITNFAADKFVINVSATNGTAGFSNPLSGGTFSLVQSGNDLNLLFTPVPPPLITINVASGTQTQTQAGYPLLSGTTPVLKTGAGTVVLNQANTLTGPTTVSQGTLQLAAANALSSSPLTVAAGATLAVGPQVATVVPSLVNNGLVDVGLGRLTVTSGQTADGIVAAIIAGRTDGTWSGTAGITSSAAATQSDRAVGWLDNGDGSFTVAFGAAGDWNLNGFVDFDDVVQFVSAELYNTGLPATWADGDFDYNGMVDFDDIVAAQSANLFNAGPYNMGSGGGASLALGGGIVAVPEPATWALGACGLVAAGWAGFRFPRAASMHRRARYTWAADAIGSRVGG
jgi:fibronectin-binding autotransporter adhesin